MTQNTNKHKDMETKGISPQAGCLLVNEIAPRLRVTARCLPKIGADDEEELYQDGLAIAASMLHSAEQLGKKVTAGNIAWFAGKQLATGRRSTYGGRADALSPAAQLDRRSLLSPLQLEVSLDPDSGEGIPLVDLLTDTAEDPAQAAARNLDWETLLSELDGLSRRMILAFARGDSMRDLKAEAGLSDSGMSGRKRQLIAAMRETLGQDCLSDACREPRWRADISVLREREACRQGLAAV